jgi:hypothetical protein
MTDDKFLKAQTLKDDILQVTKGIETIDHLFAEWEKLHAKSEDKWDFAFVDRKKEWEQIALMAEQFDSIRETVVRETVRALRGKQHELRVRLNELNKQFTKL